MRPEIEQVIERLQKAPFVTKRIKDDVQILISELKEKDKWLTALREKLEELKEKNDK